MSYIALAPSDLILAALLVLANGLVSLAFRLDLERTLLISAVRMVVQLGAIGFILQLLFVQTSVVWTLAAAAVMIAAAGYEAVARQTDRVKGWLTHGLGGATMLVVGLAATTYVSALVIGSEPWYAPRVFLPILGMVLGNALTGVALALDTLTQTVKSERQIVDARLAMGHEPFKAFEGALRRSLNTALMPILNAMAVSGIVSLPGMMTGQILAGVDPIEAAKYQIMIMFAIGGATSLAVLAAAMGGVYLLTDRRGRLRLDRLDEDMRSSASRT